MRETRTAQASIFDFYAQHEIGRELEETSTTLDQLPELVQLVTSDLFEEETKETGRTGMSAESVLRCALLKQHRQLSYQALAFHLEDSASFRSFARLSSGLVPRKSALQDNIKRIQPITWELVNQRIVRHALAEERECNETIQKAIYKHKPSAIAADGGYASVVNLAAAKLVGLKDVAFQKKKGLSIEAMASSEDRYKELCNFRAGIESNISELKRAYGLGRALWKGLEGFKACVWSAIGCYNLVKIARLKLRPT